MLVILVALHYSLMRLAHIMLSGSNNIICFTFGPLLSHDLLFNIMTFVHLFPTHFCTLFLSNSLLLCTNYLSKHFFFLSVYSLCMLFMNSEVPTAIRTIAIEYNWCSSNSLDRKCMNYHLNSLFVHLSQTIRLYVLLQQQCIHLAKISIHVECVCVCICSGNVWSWAFSTALLLW